MISIKKLGAGNIKLSFSVFAHSSSSSAITFNIYASHWLHDFWWIYEVSRIMLHFQKFHQHYCQKFIIIRKFVDVRKINDALKFIDQRYLSILFFHHQIVSLPHICVPQHDLNLTVGEFEVFFFIEEKVKCYKQCDHWSKIAPSSLIISFISIGNLSYAMSKKMWKYTQESGKLNELSGIDLFEVWGKYWRTNYMKWSILNWTEKNTEKPSRRHDKKIEFQAEFI